MMLLEPVPMSVALSDDLKRSRRTESEGATSRKKAHRRSRLVIVGGGMAGFGLCDRLVRNGAISAVDVTIIGDEPQPAYDRVNLSTYFSGRSIDQLLLAPRDWYAKHGIDLKTGCRIQRIDRQAKVAIDCDGHAYAYDQLVLATGSHAFVPPIPGADSRGVFVYRTIRDLSAIRDYCREHSARRGAVIGGGLLGLEAAKILMDFGIGVTVVERAPGLMPKQLQAQEAALLKDRVEQMGVDVQLVRRTEAIRTTDDNKVSIEFSNAAALEVDLLIIAAGVRPNDQLAEQAGLQIAPRRGVVINSKLETTDSSIYAIGECASYEDHVYGLAAPCFRMADVLSQRIAGDDLEFAGADESAELKLLGIQVASLGKPLSESPGGQVISHQDDAGYRKLLIERGRIVGASCVGPWDELPQVRQAIQQSSRLWWWQRRRFEQTGAPWTPGGVMPVTAWPADAIICSCLSVSKATITGLISDGQRDADGIAAQCGASTACGSCRSLVCELAGESAQPTRIPGATAMLAASVLTLLAALAWTLLPPIPMAESVQSAWRNIDVLWRSDLARQITGFTLLSLTLIGLLFSLRKRVDWFRFGSYGFWRAAHGILGSAVLIGIAVHTGMRLGSNLNFILGVCFITACLLGGIAGILSSMESRLSGSFGMTVRRWRPVMTRVHLWITWPLPVLIALHILSFYWFSD